MKICIIGGGTTGWWAAKYLEQKMPDANITLYEDPKISPIGVGESTLPQISTFLKDCGLDEKQWMPKTNAIFKKGSLKKNWDKINGDWCDFSFWYNDEYKFESWVKEYFKGNKTNDDLGQDLYKKDGFCEYAYHLDANLIGQVVKEQCKNVEHKLIRLEELPDGYDYYLDATGFKRRFTKDKTLIKSNDHLTNNCWAGNLQREGEPYSWTKSIARNAGWTFGIDLTNRTGIGYVLSLIHI